MEDSEDVKTIYIVQNGYLTIIEVHSTLKEAMDSLNNQDFSDIEDWFIREYRMGRGGYYEREWRPSRPKVVHWELVEN